MISGSLHLEIGGSERVLSPGEAVTIPPRVPHRFWNPTEQEVHFTGEVRPALRTEELFEHMATIARQQGATPAEPLGLVVMAPLLLEYRREVAAPRFPLWLQRAALVALAALARARARR